MITLEGVKKKKIESLRQALAQLPKEKRNDSQSHASSPQMS